MSGRLSRIPKFSLGSRLSEAATCELLLLLNFPGWAFVLPLYLISYVANVSPLPLGLIGDLARRMRGAIYRSFGLRLIETKPLTGLRFYSDIDGIWLIAAEFLKGEKSTLGSRHSEVLLDVGAHYGLVSARMAIDFPQASRIIAIEAHPENFSVLKKNIELNRLTNVSAFNFAISNSTGTVRMQAPIGASARYRVVDEEESISFPIVVQSYRLQDIVEKLGIHRVDLIKLDIEGFELKVVQDCIPTLASKVGQFDIEVHSPGDVAPIRNLLVSHGFTVRFERSGILSTAYRLLGKK